MSALAWVLVAVLTVVVVWIGLALLGAVRALAELRGRIEALEAAAEPLHLAEGLPVGAPAPPWTIIGRNGDITSGELDGRRHLVVFADADCRACDDLVPALVGAAAGRDVPPVVLVGRGDVDATPAGWFGADVRTGVERAGVVSAAFDVAERPHVFVIDEGGAVVAQGGAVTVDDVAALVRASDGIRIVPGASGG